MSFFEVPISLAGTPKRSNAMRYCAKCEQDRVPEGGVEVDANRWVSVRCWGRRPLNQAIRFPRAVQ